MSYLPELFATLGAHRRENYILVPEERFELSRLSPYASETYAYTNSATPANFLNKYCHSLDKRESKQDFQYNGTKFVCQQEASADIIPIYVSYNFSNIHNCRSPDLRHGGHGFLFGTSRDNP